MATSRKTTTPKQTLSKAAAKTAAKPAPSNKRSKLATTAAKPSSINTKATAPKRAPATSSGSTSLKAEKAVKLKKPKLVRDSFTIPKSEYEVIDTLKLRAGKLGQAPKKSELLRAGLKALAAMDDKTLQASIAAVPSIKTGRPTA